MFKGKTVIGGHSKPIFARFKTLRLQPRIHSGECSVSLDLSGDQIRAIEEQIADPKTSEGKRQVTEG